MTWTWSFAASAVWESAPPVERRAHARLREDEAHVAMRIVS